jgi:hypothetical protein
MDWTRRLTLAALSAVSSLAVSEKSFGQSEASPSAAQLPQTGQLTLSERVMYSTVRLEFPFSDKIEQFGTGFIFSFFLQDGSGVFAIVSNRHVFARDDGKGPLFEDGLFRLTLAKSDRSPDTGKFVPVVMKNIQKSLIVHPECDLAIFLIDDVIGQMILNKTPPYFSAIDQSVIPTDDQLKALVPLESIVTVGYPGNYWDNINNLPLFHRGSTASAPYINFQGRREFVIDVTTWPGASGSPVFILDEGIYPDPRHGTGLLGSRAMLLGVVYGVWSEEVHGQVFIQYAPAQFDPTASLSATKVPTNLGVCLSSSRILEFEPILVRMGAKVPSGYKMRANAM